jgi:hypothetical protein
MAGVEAVRRECDPGDLVRLIGNVARESSRTNARDERFAADADRVDPNHGDRFGDCASWSMASQLTRSNLAIRAFDQTHGRGGMIALGPMGGRRHRESDNEAHAVGREVRGYRSAAANQSSAALGGTTAAVAKERSQVR